MASVPIMDAVSIGMYLKAGYDRLNEGNLEPRIRAASNKTAESFDDLTSDHFYATIKSDEMNRYTKEFELQDEQSPTERFADLLKNEIAHDSVEDDFEAAAQEFFRNLEEEIAENDPVLWRQIELRKLDAITGFVKDIQGKDTSSPTDRVNEIVEPLESVYQHFTSKIDRELLEPVRILDNLNRTQAETVYECIVKQKIWEITDINFEKFQHELESENLIFVKLDSISPNLIINISDGFEELEYTIPSGSLADTLTLENPNLLWDCSCRFSKPQNCRIHSKDIGKEISKRFGDYTEITYRDTSVIWKDSRYFWPPSVDTIYMIENLRQEDLQSDNSEIICEIGCGTALMGIQLASMNRNISHLYVSDWLLTPLVFARINWELNKTRINEKRASDVSFTPVLGYSTYWIDHPSPGETRIDQAFCNPPYLPNLGKFNSVDEQHTVGGTALLELLIERGDKFADEIFINFSDIALPEARVAESRSPASLEQVGSTHTVPFRVPPALSSRTYMEHLIEDRDIKVRENSLYPFWHDVSTYRLSFK